MSQVLVLYHSFTGKCQELAESAAEGAQSAGAEASTKDIAEATIEDLASADAVIIGTPQPLGIIAGETKKFFERTWREREKAGKGKPLGVFVTHVSDPSGTLEFLGKMGDRYGMTKHGEWVTVKRDEVEAGKDLCRKLGASIVA
ncbi:MAG: NAD(P)H-dependent oxidoreductase [Chloroflexi bacterium]|nr:NAD(P)H-dependent oxidoreductase [Chloroflexota bacterium]